MEGLSHHEQLALFINLYHVMLLHAYLLLGPPGSGLRQAVGVHIAFSPARFAALEMPDQVFLSTSCRSDASVRRRSARAEKHAPKVGIGLYVVMVGCEHVGHASMWCSKYPCTTVRRAAGARTHWLIFMSLTGVVASCNTEHDLDCHNTDCCRALLCPLR